MKGHLTPAEKAAIETIYDHARRLTRLLGEPYEVDHIRPLSKGGRHHPSNLVVMRRDLNRRKGGRRWSGLEAWLTPPSA